MLSLLRHCHYKTSGFNYVTDKQQNDLKITTTLLELINTMLSCTSSLLRYCNYETSGFNYITDEWQNNLKITTTSLELINTIIDNDDNLSMDNNEIVTGEDEVVVKEEIETQRQEEFILILLDRG